MMLNKDNRWLLFLGLMLSATVQANISVETDSLRLRFSEQGDLLRAEQNAQFALRRNSLPELSMPSIQTHTRTEIAS